MSDLGFVLCLLPLFPGPFLLPCYQVGSQPSTAMFHSEENGSKGMDPLVLIDAIAICMAYEEKELCKIGEVALAVIFDVASIILGSKERVRTSEQFAGAWSERQHRLIPGLFLSRHASCPSSPTLWSGCAPAAMSRPGMQSWGAWCPLSFSWSGSHSRGFSRTSRHSSKLCSW